LILGGSVVGEHVRNWRGNFRDSASLDVLIDYSCRLSLCIVSVRELFDFVVLWFVMLILIFIWFEFS